ncbi:MAG: DUF4293 domain-containing protein [Muribaculum sp.]|nr:DUF4293 domain-containing protein [Muribaculum sp.]
MVIQRWQTVFLLLVFVLMGCFTFFSLGQIQTADYTFNMTTMGLSYEGEPTGTGHTGYYVTTAYFFVLSIVSALLPLVNIFLFKSFKLHRTLCIIEMMFIVAVIAVACIIGYGTFDGAAPGWSSLALAPFLALILDIMAYNFIRRDHKLLRSSDRIR